MKAFVLFRDGRRLRAAYREMAKERASLFLAGRRFTPAGQFTHLSHITDEKKRLIGFVVDRLENATASSGWREWWNTFDNRHLEDFWEAYLFLADPMPTDWHHDCALLVTGGCVLADGAGDFVIVLPDHNGFCFSPNEPVFFWTDLGFELRDLEIREDGRGSHT
jgi:hypothetical protein